MDDWLLTHTASLNGQKKARQRSSTPRPGLLTRGSNSPGLNLQGGKVSMQARNELPDTPFSSGLCGKPGTITTAGYLIQPLNTATSTPNCQAPPHHAGVLRDQSTDGRSVKRGCRGRPKHQDTEYFIRILHGMAQTPCSAETPTLSAFFQALTSAQRAVIARHAIKKCGLTYSPKKEADLLRTVKACLTRARQKVTTNDYVQAKAGTSE